MPHPQDVHVDQVLTNFGISYKQDTDEFVAEKVMPSMPVKKQSDKFSKIPKGTFNKDLMKKRADATESSGSSWKYEYDNYFCEVYAHHSDLSKRTKANADSFVMLEKTKSERLERIKLIRREKDFVASFFKTGVWGVDLDGVASGEDNVATVRKWSDPSATPVADLKLNKRRVHQLSLHRPNVMTLGREVFDVLTEHPDITSRIKTTGANEPAKVNKAMLAALFEVDELHIMDAIEDTAEEGQTPSHAYIGGQHALISYKPKVISLEDTVVSGLTMEWRGDNGETFEAGISSWWMQEIKSWRYEIEDAWVQKVVCADSAAFIENLI